MTIGEKRPSFTTDLYRRSEGELAGKTVNFHTMIAQQRLPIHMEYLQPHITTSDTKASPLALLAATCSSIGKTDSDKKEVKTTTILNKLSNREEENKSSFKPYKLDVKPSILRRSPPASNSSPLLSLSTKPTPFSSSAFYGRPPISMSVIEPEKTRCYPDSIGRDVKDMYPAPLKCHTTSPPLPHLPPKVPILSHHHHHHEHGECVQCKTVRPHSDPLPIISRPPPQGPCPCPMCSQVRSDPKCHYQPLTSLSSLYPPSYKNSQGPPVITCRDPNCTNCSKFPSTSSIQNFLHPALIHQCTHGSPPHKAPYPPPPPLPHGAGYESYIKNSHNPKPYVCNWVSDGKHCGNGFPTSEELFQHLRSHTSLQQQLNNCAPHPNTSQTVPSPSSTQNTCNIHGCPCGTNSQRKTSPRPGIPGYSYGPAVRYSPYSRPTPSSSSSFNGHSYFPHSTFHY